jgi:hypothetical protein
LGEQYKSFISSLCSLLQSPVTSSLLGPKYSPQQLILKHPQRPFLSQCQRPSFTPIQNNGQDYSYDATHTDIFSSFPPFSPFLSKYVPEPGVLW